MNRHLFFAVAMVTLMLLSGCRTRGYRAKLDAATQGTVVPAGDVRTIAPRDRIRSVYCLYDASPWLNLDRFGDRDPEGIQYRVFLSTGTINQFEKGTLQKGTFHIEMYGVKRDADGQLVRMLVSDWHYPTDAFSPIESTFNGKGYHIKLRWAKKDLAGQDVELITQFEDVDGHTVRSATKNFPIPKFTS